MSASASTFPFWMLVYRDGPAWRPVVREPGYAVAFTSTTRALQYFAAHGNPAWEFRLVCRDTLGRVTADFRGLGLRGVALDPADGAGGRLVEFAELG
ncbi:MAG: hypothetical protein K2P78_12225 [Gemmataceae bacterium]|nr:hypothetical protein [Gemmataceae bacterium]